MIFYILHIVYIFLWHLIIWHLKCNYLHTEKCSRNVQTWGISLLQTKCDFLCLSERSISILLTIKTIWMAELFFFNFSVQSWLRGFSDHNGIERLINVKRGRFFGLYDTGFWPSDQLFSLKLSADNHLLWLLQSVNN